MNVICPDCGHEAPVADALGEVEVCCPKCMSIYVIEPPTRESLVSARGAVLCPGGANWLLAALVLFVLEVAIDLAATMWLALGPAKLLEQNSKFIGALCLMDLAIFVALAFLFAGMRALRASESLGLVIMAVIADILLTLLMAFRASIAYGALTSVAAQDVSVRGPAWTQLALTGPAALVGLFAGLRVVWLIGRSDVLAAFAASRRPEEPH